MPWRSSTDLAFLDTIPAAQTQAEVCAEIQRHLPGLGMAWYFLGGAVPPGHPLLPAFKFHNWPSALIEDYTQSDLVEHSPIPRITAISARAMTLAEFRAGAAGFAPNPAAESVFAMLAAYRMTHILFVPIHGPRGPRGFAMFSGTGPDPEPRARGLLGLMGHVAFQRLGDLDAIQNPTPHGETSLTDREVDMLRALSQGLDDAGIAAAHHITVRTVRFHLSNVRHKLGARSRSEALILASKAGFLSQ